VHSGHLDNASFWNQGFERRAAEWRLELPDRILNVGTDSNRIASTAQQYTAALVVYYAPWCPRSRSLLESVRVFAGRYFPARRPSPVSFAILVVDCWSPGRCRDNINIESFPLLKVAVRGSKSKEYTGGTSAVDLERYVARLLNPVVHLRSYADVLAAYTATDSLVLGTFPGMMDHRNKTAALTRFRYSSFHRVAMLVASDGTLPRVAFGAITDPAVAEAFKLRPNNLTLRTYYGATRQSGANDTTAFKLAAWVSMADDEFRIVRSLTPENFGEELFDTTAGLNDALPEIKVVLGLRMGAADDSAVETTADGSVGRGCDKLLRAYRDLAEEFSGNFRFYSMDTAKYPEIASRLGAPDAAVASASIVDSKAGRHFTLWATGRAGKTVGKPAHRGTRAVWEVPRITYANLKDHLNAYRRDEYAQPPVTFGTAAASSFTTAALVDLTGPTFNDLVFRRTWQHALVLFYTRWCGFCKGLMPEFQALATQSYRVVVARINLEDEDLPLEIDDQVDEFPTVLFFPQGRNATALQPVRFDAEHTLEALAAFVGEHSRGHH
jgi:thiol-disulfide isomerase/thioredoxin